MKASDLPAPIPKIITWGKPGCGKTPFIMSYGSKLQLIDCDRGTRSSITLQDSFTKDRGEVDVIDCFESDPTKALGWKNTKDHIKLVYEQTSKGTYPFEVLAIDSFTTLAENAMRFVMFNSGKLNQTGIGVVQMQHWGLAISEIENLFIWLHALPIPVIVTFHDKEASEGKGDTQVTYSEISIFGKNLPRTITGKFGEIWYQKNRQTSGKMDPYLQTEGDAFILARSRERLKNGTPISLGLKEVMKQLGYVPPVKK